MKHILLTFLAERLVRAGSFFWVTAKDMLGFLAVLGGLYLLGKRLLLLDPTMGIPDPSILLLVGWKVALVYLSLFLSHAVLRLIAPTVAEWADSGAFKAVWESGKKDERTVVTLVTALAVWGVCLAALLSQ